jgi:DNA end-binding protein Ku
MAPRAYWKGSRKLSLVTCPIALYPASTQAEKTHFHQINTKTGHRLKQQLVDEQTGRVVDKDIRGEATSSRRAAMFRSRKRSWTPSSSSTHTIEIDDFVPAEQIGDISKSPTTSFPTAKRVPTRSWSYAMP